MTADWDSPKTMSAQTVKIKFHLHLFISFNQITVISSKNFLQHHLQISLYFFGNPNPWADNFKREVGKQLLLKSKSILVVVVGLSISVYASILIWHHVPMKFWKFLQWIVMVYIIKTLFSYTGCWSGCGWDVHHSPIICLIPAYSVHVLSFILLFKSSFLGATRSMICL